MEADALKYLHQHLEHYKLINTVESESDLIARPCDTAIESLERFQAAPNRIKQKVRHNSMASFIAYVNRFKEASTSIYMNTAGTPEQFVAMIDHYEKDKPSWCDHLAAYPPQPSLEWLAWTGINTKKLSQVELAHFIEANLKDIMEPEPNDMLKAALDFQSVENMVVGSTQNLDDGSVKFNFTKENANKSVSFPHRLKIIIPIYENEPPVELELRVRYRTSSEGVLTFNVSFIDNPGRIERDALREMAKVITEGTEVLVYEGSMKV